MTAVRRRPLAQHEYDAGTEKCRKQRDELQREKGLGDPPNQAITIRGEIHMRGREICRDPDHAEILHIDHEDAENGKTPERIESDKSFRARCRRHKIPLSGEFARFPPHSYRDFTHIKLIVN